uniref:Uncharacterized protein n=1 Tax=Rhizophora mucronata TaxID=61149 RepID=A0A2P2NUL8_RHIMU
MCPSNLVSYCTFLLITLIQFVC